jgi:hypothetical protein
MSTRIIASAGYCILVIDPFVHSSNPLALEPKFMLVEREMQKRVVVRHRMTTPGTG